MEEKLSKIQKFIEDREKLKKSPVITTSSSSIFSDKNPKIKSLEGAAKPTEVKDVIKLTPERFKNVQNRLKAGSAIKDKLNAAIKANDSKAAKTIVSQVGEVAKKTGNTELLQQLIKKVAKSGLAKKAGKKLLSAIPLVGGAAAALSSGDIKAAVPGLDFIDDVGPKKGSLDERIESGTITAADVARLKK